MTVTVKISRAAKLPVTLTADCIGRDYLVLNDLPLVRNCHLPGLAACRGLHFHVISNINLQYWKVGQTGVTPLTRPRPAAYEARKFLI